LNKAYGISKAMRDEMEGQDEQVYEPPKLEVAPELKGLREMELFNTEVLATISHELRSPLTAIKGYAATLLRHEGRISRVERREFLLAINEASDHLEVIINRLLEVSQLETGAITIDRTPINLAFLVREAILTTEERLLKLQNEQELKPNQGRHFTFILQLEDGQGQRTSEEPVIQADRIRLREVLDNLLGNAINYSPAGGAVEVVIRPIVSQSQGKESDLPEEATREFALHQRIMEIAVRDRGIGIPTEQLETIFTRFHRVDTRLTREINGPGLGLAICKHIVELHNGIIWAESEPDKGSTFRVWLPVE
jgi:signal transduction histidine kinase